MSQLDQFVVGIYGRVAKAMGVAAPLIYRSYTVGNAASDGRYIYYNPNWVAAVLGRYCNSELCILAVVAGVLAHELAHHQYGDALCYNCNRRRQELRADYEAGRALAKMGVHSRDFEVVVAELNVESHLYPSSYCRSDAIRRGFNEVLAEVERARRRSSALAGAGSGMAGFLGILLLIWGLTR